MGIFEPVPWSFESRSIYVIVLGADICTFVQYTAPTYVRGNGGMAYLLFFLYPNIKSCAFMYFLVSMDPSSHAGYANSAFVF
jgi:hypothetical protein